VSGSGARDSAKVDGILAQLNPVSHIVRPHRLATTLLSAVVALALTGNALVTVFCPHMSGRQCCVKAAPAQPQSAKVEDNHSHNAEMSEMDMSDEAMDMSEAQTGAANSSRSESDSSLADYATQPAGDEQTTEVITRPTEPCSHCMMHSQTDSNYSLRAAIDNSHSYESIAADGPAEILALLSPTPRCAEVYDHGPPGSSAPLYVLVRSFRI